MTTWTEEREAEIRKYLTRYSSMEAEWVRDLLSWLDEERTKFEMYVEEEKLWTVPMGKFQLLQKTLAAVEKERDELLKGRDLLTQEIKRLEELKEYDLLSKIADLANERDGLRLQLEAIKLGPGDMSLPRKQYDELLAEMVYCNKKREEANARAAKLEAALRWLWDQFHYGDGGWENEDGESIDSDLDEIGKLIREVKP
jgi:hypothetical protein